jgi:hypothetical protein
VSTASLALGRKTDNRMTEILHESVSRVISETGSAVAEAREYKTAEQWHQQLQTRVSVAAASAEFIPVVHAFGILAELPYLFYLMGRGAIGTGALMGAEIDAETDLRVIFGLWSGAIPTRTLVTAEGGAVVVNYNGGAILVTSLAHPAYGAKVLALGFKYGTKALAADAGGVAATVIADSAGPVSQMLQPIFGKVLVKISPKVSAKFVADFVPILGAAVSVAISRHVLKEFLTSAKLYYEHKIKDATTPKACLAGGACV